MPGPEWQAHASYPRFREIDEVDPLPRREPGRAYPRFRGIDEPDAFSSGKASVKSKEVEPDAANRSGRGRALALAGIVVAGVLAIAIVLAQRGAPGLSPRQSAKSFPPVAARTTAPAPAVLGPQAGLVGEAATAVPAVVKSPGEASAAEPKAAKGRPETHTRTEKPAQRLAIAAASSEPRSESGRPCNGMGGMALARCMRPQILDADRDLRDAYHDAVRSGVERQVLVAYQRQWSALRRRALSDPRSVADSYRQMADELDAQADRRADDF